MALVVSAVARMRELGAGVVGRGWRRSGAALMVKGRGGEGDGSQGRRWWVRPGVAWLVGEGRGGVGG